MAYTFFFVLLQEEKLDESDGGRPLSASERAALMAKLSGKTTQIVATAPPMMQPRVVVPQMASTCVIIKVDERKALRGRDD